MQRVHLFICFIFVVIGSSVSSPLFGQASSVIERVPHDPGRGARIWAWVWSSGILSPWGATSVFWVALPLIGGINYILNMGAYKPTASKN